MSIFEYDEEEEMKLIRKQEREAAMEEGLVIGITAFLALCQDVPLSKEEALAKLTSQFALSEDTAKAYIDKYWKNT